MPCSILIACGFPSRPVMGLFGGAPARRTGAFFLGDPPQQVRCTGWQGEALPISVEGARRKACLRSRGRAVGTLGPCAAPIWPNGCFYETASKAHNE
jgi:hypothetical protein